MNRDFYATELSVFVASGISWPIPILMEDDILHTDERPFCSDPSCPCWQETVERMASDIVAYYAELQRDHAEQEDR